MCVAGKRRKPGWPPSSSTWNGRCCASNASCFRARGARGAPWKSPSATPSRARSPPTRSETGWCTRPGPLREGGAAGTGVSSLRGRLRPVPRPPRGAGGVARALGRPLNAECCVAARGTTTRRTCVPRTATGTPPGTGTTTTVSVLPARPARRSPRAHGCRERASGRPGPVMTSAPRLARSVGCRAVPALGLPGRWALPFFIRCYRSFVEHDGR